MRMRFLIYSFFLGILLGLIPHSLSSQNFKVDILSYEFNSASNTFDLNILVQKDGKPYELIKDDRFEIRELIGDIGAPLSIQHLSRINPNEENLVQNGRPNYKLYTRSANPLFKGTRSYSLAFYVGEEMATRATKRFSFATERVLGDNTQFLNYFIGGGLLVAILLLILSEGIPWIRAARFKQNYGKRYSELQVNGERLFHPISGEPLEATDWVVKKCELAKCAVPLDVWKKNNYQCLHYRECEGHVNVGKQRFFRQLGVFRQLNWLWFGTLGGLLAWGAQFLLDRNLLGTYAEFLQTISPQISSGMAAQSLLGFSLGLCMTLVLAWVDEEGQGRNFRFFLVILKILLGGILGALIFMAGAFLTDFNRVLAGLISWLLLGMALGLILSLASYIALFRGVLGGASAATISFGIYHLLIELTQSVQFPRLLGFLLFGAIFGWTVIKVVKELEQIELEVLQPAYRNGFKFIIDKWLKVEKEGVFIGKGMKNKIRVKWDDREAGERHARIYVKAGKVFVAPFKGQQIWVNGKMLSGDGEVSLSGGEHIWLGRHRFTEFRYNQKFSN